MGAYNYFSTIGKTKHIRLVLCASGRTSRVRWCQMEYRVGFAMFLYFVNASTPTSNMPHSEPWDVNTIILLISKYTSMENYNIPCPYETWKLDGARLERRQTGSTPNRLICSMTSRSTTRAWEVGESYIHSYMSPGREPDPVSMYA
jgi:hypothetical protein